MVESTPANTAYEELLCLSIGVTQYEEHLNFETVPSASFDSIMVTNHFTQKGFNCEQLHNPSVEEVQNHLKLLQSKVKDIKKLTPKKEVYVVIYYTGYATEQNDIILTNGDTLSLELHAKEYLSYQKVAVLLFQDCMCSKDIPNYGEILQLNFSIKSNPVRLFRCLFRNNTLDRFLKYKIHAQLTNRILLGDMAALLFHRSKVINQDRLDLFIQERELDEFMRTYFTESQNIYAGEIRLIIYRDFQAQLAKYLVEIKKEKETPKLMNFIKLDQVANQYCEVVGEMTPINFDLSDHYKFLDIRVPYGKRQQPFSIIYNDDRIAVLMINQTRCGITGSFSLQGSGVSDHKIVKVTQAAFGQDLYACTNKGKLVRLSLDSGGQLIPAGTFKLPNRIENTEVSSISEYDGILICGLDIGIIQMYRITRDKTSMQIEHMKNVEIFQSHISISDLQFTRNGFASKKWDATYNLLVSGCLNKTYSSWFVKNQKVILAASSSEKQVDGSNMFVDFLVEHKQGEGYKFVNKNRLSNQTNVFNIYAPNEYGKVLFINEKSLIYYDMITHKPINTHSIQNTKYQYVNPGDFISQTMLTSKNLSERFYCIPNQFSRILLFCPKRSLLFTLYHSHYASLKFIGKIIFTSSDTFSALVEGEETLEVVQFKIDKELINALSCE